MSLQQELSEQQLANGYRLELAASFVGDVDWLHWLLVVRVVSPVRRGVAFGSAEIHRLQEDGSAAITSIFKSAQYFDPAASALVAFFGVLFAVMSGFQ